MIERGMGGFFVQDDEDDLYYLLTCTGVGDIALPAGDLTPVYCPSPSEVGKFVVDGKLEGVPGLVTYSLDRPLRGVLNYLLTELRECDFHGRVNWRNKGGVPDDPTNYLIAAWLPFSRATTRGIPQPVAATPDNNERVNTTADISAEDWEIIYQVEMSRVTQTEVSAINGIAFSPSRECYTDEVGGDPLGKDGYYTTDFLATSATNQADVWYTTDGGVTWTACDVTPFGGGESIGAVVARGERVIVARLTAQAGDPAEIAYSDDYGATWSLVDVGATNNQVIRAMVWEDYTHLWAVATGGYVYFSDDAGETWTTQDAGATTVQNLLAVDSYDQDNVWACGASGAIIKTTDGGSSWTLVTGPVGIADDFQAIGMRNANRVFIGSDAGVLYVTADGGTTWTAKGTPSLSGGAITALMFDPDYDYHGYVVGNTAAGAGRCWRTEDGGASWQRLGNLSNSGFNCVATLDLNHAWVGGEPQGGTAFLGHIQPVSTVS